MRQKLILNILARNTHQINRNAYRVSQHIAINGGSNSLKLAGLLKGGGISGEQARDHDFPRSVYYPMLHNEKARHMLAYLYPHYAQMYKTDEELTYREYEAFCSKPEASDILLLRMCYDNFQYGYKVTNDQLYTATMIDMIHYDPKAFICRFNCLCDAVEEGFN